MLIFGHKLIEKPEFCWLTRAEFKQNAVNCFIYDESLIQKAQKAGVKFGILAQNADEILLANALKAEFILLENENLAKKASKMAEFYLFDSKILLITNSLEKLEKAYKMGVDGVILKELLQEIPIRKAITF